ncbi:hypothetical protein SUDANB121_01293 [Nocardiopsis dassonvillei]
MDAAPGGAGARREVGRDRRPVPPGDRGGRPEPAPPVPGDARVRRSRRAAPDPPGRGTGRVRHAGTGQAAVPLSRMRSLIHSPAGLSEVQSPEAHAPVRNTAPERKSSEKFQLTQLIRSSSIRSR